MGEKLRLSVEVPDGADDEQHRLFEEMSELFEERLQLFVDKNIDYSSSFLTAGEVEQVLDDGGGPFESAEDANLYKLFTRIQDKNQRFYQQAFGGGEQRVDESAVETAGDAAVYWFMVNWLLSYSEDETTVEITVDTSDVQGVFERGPQ
ncbi:hypothetical protein HAPG_00048 [Halorubrum phage GNf2]|nr:hypothetical protein HAPG_00048 [Halorubrum phage GNf2]